MDHSFNPSRNKLVTSLRYSLCSAQWVTDSKTRASQRISVLEYPHAHMLSLSASFFGPDGNLKPFKCSSTYSCRRTASAYRRNWKVNVCNLTAFTVSECRITLQPLLFVYACSSGNRWFFLCLKRRITNTLTVSLSSKNDIWKINW